MNIRSLEDLKKNREEILKISSRHGASNVRVFGSVARGEATERSDVDFLVDIDKTRDLFDWVALHQELSEFLERKADITTDEALHRRVRDRVLSEAKPL